ncbi:putative reverse transcriptase domain-containing protein [Tanacetum coccineum]
MTCLVAFSYLVLLIYEITPSDIQHFAATQIWRCYNIPESKQPPRKRLCLPTLGSRFVSIVDAEARRQGISEVGYDIRDTWVYPAEAVYEIAPTTLGEVNTRVTKLAEIYERDTQDLYALLEEARDARTRISQRVAMDSQRVDLLIGDKMTLQETVWIVEEEAYASQEAWAHSIGLNPGTSDTATTAGHSYSDTTLDMGNMQAELLALRGQQRRARQPRPDARIPDHQDAFGDADSHIYTSAKLHQRKWKPQFHGDNRRNVQTARPCFYADFMKCQPLNFKGTEGVVGLTRWIEKMESVFNISGCAIENQVKFSTCTLLGAALTWWNGHIRTLGPNAYSMTWEVLKKKMTDKYCPQGEIKKLEIELWNLKYISGLPDNIYGNVKSARPKTLDETIELANELMDQKLRTYAERQSDNKRKADDSSRNNHGHQQQPFKRQNVAKVYNIGIGEKKPYGGSLPKSFGNTNGTDTQKGNGANPKGNGCFECGAPGHFKRDCPKLKNKDGGNGNAQGWVYAVGNAEKIGNA